MAASLDEFLGETPAVPGELQPPPPGSLPAAEAPQAPEPEPEFTTSVTPSGIEVLYQWAPKRLYRVRNAPDRIKDPMFSNYEGAFDWVEVPSVTTVLKVLDKPALPWWGMKVGVAGVLELAKRSILVPADFDPVFLGTPDAWDVDSIIDALKREKLTTNHTLDKAGDRGNSVHDAFEKWALEGILPHPEIYPEEEKGYVAGLRKFIDAVTLDSLESEVMVGSLAHGFAGRYDLRARLLEDAQVQTRVYPKRAPKVETISAGRYLLDLKTSKGVYDTHFLQLEAYEAASLECGYEPTDYRAVIHVTADGEYELVASRATFDDYLAVKGAHDALERIKERK